MKRLFFDFVAPLLVALVIFGGLFVFAFPSRVWLDQRAEAQEGDQQMLELKVESELLRADIARLQTTGEIERIAREDFNLVFPGEEAYALLPAPEGPITLPTSWPFAVIHDQHNQGASETSG